MKRSGVVSVGTTVGVSNLAQNGNTCNAAKEIGYRCHLAPLYLFDEKAKNGQGIIHRGDTVDLFACSPCVQWRPKMDQQPEQVEYPNWGITTWGNKLHGRNLVLSHTE